MYLMSFYEGENEEMVLVEVKHELFKISGVFKLQCCLKKQCHFKKSGLLKY